jgi:hypothetical protein
LTEDISELIRGQRYSESRFDAEARAIEAAFDVHAFALGRSLNDPRLCAIMTGMSILAMAMVICLFGGYVDPPEEPRISTATRTI